MTNFVANQPLALGISRNAATIWGQGETALPGNPSGELQVVEGDPVGGNSHQLTGILSAFTPDYAPEEMMETAAKLTKAVYQGAGSL